MIGKRKPEEHVNHERWLVSYADMVTLLLALFVTLYAMGVTELAKVQEVSRSIRFAFHIAGEGKTREEGVFDTKGGGGDVPEPAPLLNAQDGEMLEFLSQTLPRDFEQVTGRSLEVVVMDDTVSFRAPLSAFFPPDQAYPVRPEVLLWLGRAVVGSLAFTAGIRVRIEAADLTIGEQPNGRRITSRDLCLDRLRTLSNVVSNQPQVRHWMVELEFAYQPDVPAAPGGGGAGPGWEDRAAVILAFSNRRQR